MAILVQLRKEAGFTPDGIADFLGVSLPEYLSMEQDVDSVPYDRLERLADLYHVEEYDILTGTAKGMTYTSSPKQEEELIPFFKIVRNYMKMVRLLKDCDDKH